jgi:hypothetical protein
VVEEKAGAGGVGQAVQIPQDNHCNVYSDHWDHMTFAVRVIGHHPTGNTDKDLHACSGYEGADGGTLSMRV